MIKRWILATLLLASSLSFGQAWSTFLDPTRAIDWTAAGFSIPNYTVNCATQPTLGGNAATNTAQINSALASCDATHNVVNLPSGTYHLANGFVYQGDNQVVRGVGAATHLIPDASPSCAGEGGSVCMLALNWTYNGNSNVLPPSGTNQCLWSSNYSQGTTSIGVTSCGGTPPNGAMIIIDQADDTTADNGGIWNCDGSVSNCTYEGSFNGGGRLISGVHHGVQQTVLITSVTSLGGGAYTLTINPPIMLTSFRSGQAPGIWWPGQIKNIGLENVFLDTSAISGASGVVMFSAYRAWVKGVTFDNCARTCVLNFQTLQNVIRDNYFYGAQSHLSTSYTIEPDATSGLLIENNIFQQVTTPATYNDGCQGCVFDYNFSVDQIFGAGGFTWQFYVSHNLNNTFNLTEGNVMNGIAADNASGPGDINTAFRNLLTGLQPGNTTTSVPTILRANVRAHNYIGNVLGTAGYHNQYQAIATSTTTSSGSGAEYTSIYSLGAGGTGFACSLNPGQSTLCDPLTVSTIMRWGNYDVVNAVVKFDSTEASPGAVTYVSANFTSTYFNSLAHTLPSSLYYSSKPSWWPVGKAFPSIGPDISTGNVGTCSGGTYAGWLATSAGQCTGGTLPTAWASHVISNPAMDCYLGNMAGPLDGSGSVLTFNAAACYPSIFSASANLQGSVKAAGAVVLK